MRSATSPEDGDIVVREERRGETPVYVLQTALGGDHSAPIREEAIAKALVWAERQHVRVWVTDAGDLALLEDFRLSA